MKEQAGESEGQLTVFRATRVRELTEGQDAFGHRDYAAAISEVLLEAESPFTLGLFGPWGVGKTVIINEARRAIGDKCASVVFDAWRYDGDALRRHFLRDVAQQLKAQGDLEDSYDPEKELKDLDVSRSEPAVGKIRIATTQLIIGAVGLALIGFVALGLWLADDLKHALGGLITVAAAGLVALAVAALSPFARIIEVTQATEVRQRVVDPERFTEKFEDLLAAVKKSRLVVAIDNLDRCSPRRVTELLETLNTYLEPASVAGSERSERLRKRRNGTDKPDAVFAVAADDAALKRHIESQEIEASTGAHDDVRSDVGRYADEYLRKIFTVTIPIKPALGPDLRAYVDTELTILVEKRGIEPEDRNRLVEVITEGLRRNPRRVTQFIRNLELRLRLLDERHQGQRIVEKLTASEHIALVAKLLVLEEEWLKAYREIERDSSRLALWHQQQQDATTDVPDFDGLDFSKETEQSRQGFVSFLAATRTITSTRLPAFLSLKQSRQEIKLPRYSDFETALTSGQPELLREITEAAQAEQLQGYADELLPLLKTQLPRYRATGRLVLETALADPVLSEKTRPQLAEMLKWAVGRDEPFRVELAQANPDLVLGASAWLTDDSDFNQVVKLFVSRLPVSAVTSLPAARVDESNLRLVRDALKTEEMLPAGPSALGVLRWNQKVASPEVATAALQRLTATFDPNGPDAEIVEISLRTVWRDQAAGDQVLTAAGTLVAAAYAAATPMPAADRVALVAALVPLVRQIGENDQATAGEPSAARTSAVAGLVQAVESGLALVGDPAEVEPLLDLVGELGRVSGIADMTLITKTVDAMRTTHPDAMIAYGKVRGKEICHTLLSEMAQALGALVDGERADAAQAIAAIDPADDQAQLTAAAIRAVEGKRYPFATQLLSDHRAQLDTHRQALAMVPLGTETIDLGGLRFSLTLANTLTEEGLSQLEQRLARYITATVASQSNEDLLAAVETSPVFGQDRFRRFIWQLWDQIKTDPATPPIELLQLLLPRFETLDEIRRNAFPQLIKGWLADARGAELLHVLKAVPFKGKPKTELVTVVLERQDLLASTEHEQRAELYRCAQSIAQGSAPATKKVDDRIGLLQSGTPDDQAVFQLLHPVDEAEVTVKSDDEA